MLTSIFDQATKSVTKTVLYAGLFPVAAMVLLNGGAATFLLGPGAVAMLGAWLARSATAAATAVMVGIIFLVIAAIAVASLAPMFRGMLEGRISLPIVGPLLEVGRAQAATAADVQRLSQTETLKNLTRRSRLRADQERLLTKAYTGARPAWGEQPDAVQGVTQDIDATLERDLSEQGARAAVERLAAHVTRYGVSGTQRAHQAVLRRLDSLVEEESGKLANVSRLAAELPTADGPVTDYGRQLHFIELYVRAVYGIESVVFWTRLQSVIPATFAASLEDAKHSLDLLTAITVLVWTSGLAWLVAIPAWFPDPRVLLATTAAAAVVGYVLYRSAVAAALSFAELVCAAFDLFRRDLLAALSVTPPASLREERKLWLELGRLMIYEQQPDDLPLTPPGSFVPARAGLKTPSVATTTTGPLVVPGPGMATGR